MRIILEEKINYLFQVNNSSTEIKRRELYKARDQGVWTWVEVLTASLLLEETVNTKVKDEGVITMEILESKVW